MEEALPYILAGVPLSIMVLYAFWLYCRDEEEINFGTWFILAYGDILDFGSYFSMTEKWWLNFVPFAFAVGSISTFFYALGQKRFGKIRRIDIFCITADIGITVLALTSGFSLFGWIGPWFEDAGTATVANLAYQGTAIIAFVPMLWSQIEGREIENPTPWLLWAFVFGAFCVVMAYGYQKWEELAYPVVNLFTHFMIGVAAFLAVLKLRSTTPLRV